MLLHLAQFPLPTLLVWAEDPRSVIESSQSGFPFEAGVQVAKPCLTYANVASREGTSLCNYPVSLMDCMQVVEHLRNALKLNSGSVLSMTRAAASTPCPASASASSGLQQY
jgi:hypothetical protein